MRSLKIVGLIVLLCALPLLAQAQTTGTSQLSSLLAELSQLEQQLQSFSATTTTTVAATSTPPSSNMAASNPEGICPDLSRSLSIGSSGADVAGLQAFLAGEGLFKAIGTGYFGTVTQASVGQWQEENGVVSGGDAASTGLGVVGPRTRAAMEASCLPGNASQSNSCMTVLPPAAECPTGWQPVSGSSGCTVYYQCVTILPSTATSSTSIQSSSAPATTSCPVVQQPTCSGGTIAPFETNSNGCVTAYECVL